jgi:hypothetical protein
VDVEEPAGWTEASMRGMPLVVVPAGEVTVTGTTAGLGLKLMPVVTVHVTVAVPLVPTVAAGQLKSVRSIETVEPLPKPVTVTDMVDPTGNVVAVDPAERDTGIRPTVPLVVFDVVGCPTARPTWTEPEEDALG